jgi:hypothetical protein
MAEACAKLYGEAAGPHMMQFYRTLEAAMLGTKEAGGNWSLPSPELIYSVEAEEAATTHLEKATAATTDPAALARIAAERKTWAKAREVLSKLRADSTGATTFGVKLDDKSATWRSPMIDEQTIRDLFDLASDAPLRAVEPDGQTRGVNPGERFDLRTNIRFREAK